ncbi:hypothetical protein D9M68_554800 [compost metagenome]
MTAPGKRWRSFLASAAGRGSPQNRKVRSVGSAAGEKSRLASCWCANDGVDTHTVTPCSASRGIQVPAAAICSRAFSTQVPPEARVANTSYMERSKLNGAWFMNTGASPSPKLPSIQSPSRPTLSRPICTPFGSPVLPDVNMT